MRGALLAVSLLVASACKDQQEAKPTAPPPAPTPAPSPRPAASTPAAPALPSSEPSVPETIDKPITVDEATAILPDLGGKEILALKPTSNGRQVHGTWCLDGDGADDVARKVGHALAEAKYTALSIRGDARKAGVQGDRDGLRVSMVVSASTAVTCPAPQHYFASATIYKP